MPTFRAEKERLRPCWRPERDSNGGYGPICEFAVAYNEVVPQGPPLIITAVLISTRNIPPIMPPNSAPGRLRRRDDTDGRQSEADGAPARQKLRGGRGEMCGDMSDYSALC
jgi:hypothetical protein